MTPDRKAELQKLIVPGSQVEPMTVKPRDLVESVFEGMEDVFQGETYLGWIAPAKHGKKERDWWHFQPWGKAIDTIKGREAALKSLQKAICVR